MLNFQGKNILINKKMKNRVPLSVFLNVKIKEPLEHQVY